MQILKFIWGKWKKIAHRIGIFQSKVILTLFYFTILLPFGMVLAIFKDELKIKNTASSTWIPKTSRQNSLEELKNQY